MKTIAISVLGAWIGLAVFAAPPALAQQQSTYPLRSYLTAHRGPEPPDLDGRLDDPCWERVEWASDFVQFEPDEGKEPSEETAFKILYDEHALYIGYRAHDREPEKIVSRLARRDRFPGDWVEINIDSYDDDRTAFSFTASVSGTRGDEFISDDGDNWDGNWDPVWQLATNIDSEGWTAEVMIPLSQLRFGNKEEHVWGIQVTRRLFRQEERSVWQPKSKNESGWVSRFGELRGIRGISAPRQVELLPYTVTKAERFEKIPGDPFNDGSDANLSGGVDGKIGVTSDLTLDFTVNPDFGQVEADPSEVNLSAFETFFREKRPFFIEGINILEFQVAPSIAGGSFTADNMFYSRRIGRRPSASPNLGDDEYADVPGNSSIISALKLTGKTKHGLSIGVLESVAAKERARIDLLGERRDETVEPLSNYFVGRLQQDFDRGNTRVGGIFTAANRKIDEPQLEFLHRSAYSGGFDFLHQWKDKSWYVALNGALSRVEGEPEALLETQRASARYFQRPDNDYESVDSTRTTLSGHAGSARFSKSGGGNLRFETGVAWRSPGFEINDIGFMRRADEVNQFTWMGYSIRNPFSIFRRLAVNTNQWLNWDFGGTLLSKRANINSNTSFKNNWHMGAGFTRTWESVSNTTLRGGPSFTSPGESEFNFWVDSDSRRSVNFGVGGYFSDGDEESWNYREGWSYVSIRPSNAWRISLDPSVSTNKRELQFVDTISFGDEPRYVFGSLNQRTASLTIRLDYTVMPNLTVEYYGAPFVSSGSYSDFKRITDPRAESYRDRFATYASDEISDVSDDGEYTVDEDGDQATDYTIGNPDFNFRDFNSNLVVRWEFQPGSLMYFVWSQSRSDFVPVGNFALRNDVGSLFNVQPHNVVLVKVSKWFSL